MVRGTISRMTIYLDHAATTPMRPEVLEAMLPLLTGTFGNPSSPHAQGRRARAALDEAHETLARAIGAEPREIVFTASGTEATNLAVKGAAWAGKASGNQIVTTAVEHHATLHAVRHLEKFGFEAIVLPVDRYGRVDPEAVDATITDRTVLVTVMLANNEVGTIQPIAEIVERVRRHRRVLIHVDAVQGAPYLDLDVRSLDIDLLSLGAHKLEGPKGMGVLYIRHGTTLLPQTHGGSQERHRRAGTENVAGAVGMARALELCVAERPETVRRLRRLRDRLAQATLAVPGVELTGHPKERLAGHLSVIARDADGDAIALSLDLEGIACSTGSACTTGSTEPSHVLSAMGYPEEEARGALRLTLGRTTTADEIEVAVRTVPPCIARMRAASAAVTADPLGLEVPA
ncbi:MAG: cysteine desulfurase [Chloroflexi bacterium]|nr:cysteine desulfurase [Chloroflexota bacterium]